MVNEPKASRLAMEILIQYTGGTVELLAHQLVFAPSETRNFKGKPSR